MFDALYPDAADVALTAKASRKPEPQAARFSTWSMFAAAPKGVAAGAAEATGSTADILGAFGQVMAATDARPGGMFSIPERKLSDLIKGGTEQELASKKLLNSGIDFNSEAGRSFRNVSADYTPDAQTAHVAESAVFNLFRVGSKALTSAATMGNVPGAIVAGLEEGFTTSDQLGQQGVDLATRSKVGAVTALTNAVGFALPVAGKTWLQTGALALAGGPASFIAQNAATREILQAADYSKLADQYDPLDPVGLALSTLLPLGFGALAMRGAKVKAKGPMPDGTPPPEPPKMVPPDDLVDAARVNLVREHMDATNPKAGDLEAADAHSKAYKQAMEQQAAGERVQVDVPEPVAVRATEEMGARIDAAKQADSVEVVAKPDSDFVQAKSDAGLVGGHVRDGALHITTAEVDPAYRGQGEGIKLYTALVDDALAKGQRVFSDSTVEASAVRMYEALQRRGYEVKRLEGGSLEDGAAYGKGAKEPAFEVVGKTEPKPAPALADTAQTATKTIADASGFNPAAIATQAADLLATGKPVAQVIGELEAVGTKVTPELQNMLVGASEFGGRLNDLVDQVNALKAQRGANAQPFDLIAQAVENLRTGQVVEAPKQGNALAAKIDEISYRNPNALDAEIAVAFDDKGKPTSTMTARDYLDMVKREAASDAQDASLFEVAANCFLSGGV